MKSAVKSAKKLKPDWIKVPLPSGENYTRIKSLRKTLGLSTVCEEALCPNIAECWGGGTATFMLMGDICTRGCRFCSVKTGRPRALDEKEPEKLGIALSQMGLEYVVLTSVDRDDLFDHGSGHFSKTVKTIKSYNPSLLVEVLTPDFNGEDVFIQKVLRASPDVYAHNIETVESLQKLVRDPRASYEKSFHVLQYVKKSKPSMITKTSLMLGLGEKESEILKTLEDLRAIDCNVVTFGQYLQPLRYKLKVKEYVSPETFQLWKERAEAMGFLYVASGPLVRSSYRAGEFFIKSRIQEQKSLKKEERSKNVN